MKFPHLCVLLWGVCILVMFLWFSCGKSHLGIVSYPWRITKNPNHHHHHPNIFPNLPHMSHSFPILSGKRLQFANWKMTQLKSKKFTHWTWWFSIAMRVCPISSSAMAVGMTDPQEDWPLVVLAAAEAICDLSEALRRAGASDRVINGECLPQLRVTITNYQPTMRLL